MNEVGLFNRLKYPSGVLNGPHEAYVYAYDTLRGRFEAGEEVIATNALYAHIYAADVLRGRFEAGEEVIATDSYCSCFYAIDVLHGRFILGEEVIAASEYYAEKYARYALKEDLYYKGKLIAKCK